MPKRRKISTSNKITKKKRKGTNSNKNATVIVNKEKHMDNDARKKVSKLTDNPDPKTEKPLKVENIYRLLMVRGIENYKVTKT